MALRLQINNTSTNVSWIYAVIDAVNNVQTIEVKDATGDYNVTTNPGGYGTPNNARNTYGLKLFVIEKSTAGDVILTNTLQSPSTPTAKTVTAWRFDNVSGGYHSFYLCAITDYSNSIDYTVGELVWDDGEDDFFECLDANGPGSTVKAVTDTDYWKPISDYTDQEALVVFQTAEELADANDLMEFIDIDDAASMITYNMDVAIAGLFGQAECSCDDACKLTDYEKARMEGEGVLIKFFVKSYVTAQSMYEKLMNRL